MKRRTPLLCVLVYFVVLTGFAFSQPPYTPPQPPQYAVYYRWQPVYVPGDYYAVPRYCPLVECLFGPRVVFVPRPVQQPQQYQPDGSR